MGVFMRLFYSKRNSRGEPFNLKIALVTIPKTIDNDISFVAKTFGFDTAVESAANVIQSASVESNFCIMV